MEDETDIKLETEDLEDVVSDEVSTMEPKVITNFEILQIIFSRTTAPHAIALSIFLIALGVFSRSSSLVDLILVLGFGFSLGYLMTAVLIRFDFVKNLCVGDSRTVLIVPLLLSLFVSLLIWYIFNYEEYGNRLKTILSWSLIVIFILWQFAQAWWMRVPFREMALSRMSKVTSTAQTNFGQFSNILSPLVWSLIGFGIFSLLETRDFFFSSTFKIMWFVVMAALGSFAFYILFRMNSRHWSDPGISAFSAYFAIGYWSFLAYHVGVMLYSRESEPSFVFDLVFMVITIILVIYSLSVQALRSETRDGKNRRRLKIMNRHNVIFYAISFTAAYGASSFFLASKGTMFIDNIKNIGFISHLIVIASGILVILLVNYTALVGRGLINQGFVNSIRTPKNN